MMPELDGPETCRQLKADPATASIPVIFLTAKSQEAEIQRGLSLGAAGYVTKPFDALTLGQHVKDIVDNAASVFSRDSIRNRTRAFLALVADPDPRRGHDRVHPLRAEHRGRHRRRAPAHVRGAAASTARYGARSSSSNTISTICGAGSAGDARSAPARADRRQRLPGARATLVREPEQQQRLAQIRTISSSGRPTGTRRRAVRLTRSAARA